VFSGSAGLLMPLTADTRVLPYYLDLAQPALLDTPGSNLAAALELARQTLGQQAARRGAVLLLTDGDATALSGAAGAAALDAARQLDRAGLPLSVLALGSATGATIPLPDGGVLEYDGAPVTSVLDAAGYTTLARLGGGRYASVTDGQADLESLYDDGILKLPANAVPPDPAQAWRELYAWCLLPAWVLLLWVWLPMPKRQVQVALWLFGVMLLAGQIPRSAVAAESDPAQAAYRAYQAGRYVEAQAWYGQMQGYAAAMGGGASAYRRRDYIEAIHQFTQALLRADQTGSRADALYNLGNSYFAVGRLQAAADAYLGVLKLRPHDARAVANLALTAGQRSKPKPEARPTDGVPGRHGEQLGEMRDNGIVPLGMEDSKPKSGMEVDLTPTQRAAAEARLRSAANGQAGRAIVSEQVYQAALKKLELTPDQAEKIQHNLLQQDGRADAAALLPW
jgi:Ca-activated chloride channel family protein